MTLVSSMRKKSFKVDLIKIEGEGAFPCPKCGTIISPDDETEKTYAVLDAIMEDDDTLESVLIRCNTCKSTITLNGFNELSEEGSRIEITEASPESKPNYRTYHMISLDNNRLGQLIVEYAQKEDVKAFKRLKKIRLGDPFKSIINIENMGKAVQNENLRMITKVVKRKFKGLKDNDIYITEIKDGHKKVIGRASNL